MIQRILARGVLLLCVAVSMATVTGSAMAADPVAPKPSILSPQATKSLLLDVARAGDRLVAVGERGHVLLSDDDGTTWRQVPTPTRALLTAVHFSSAQSGWAVGHDSTILNTVDGGATWTQQYHATFDAAAVEAELEEQLAAEGDDFADEGGDAQRPPSQAQRIGAALMDVWFDAAGRHGLAIGAYGLLLASDDGGAHWSDHSQALDNPEGMHLTAMAAGAGSNLLVVGEKGVAFGSADAGRTFARVKTPEESSLFGVTRGAAGYWAYGLQGRLYRVAGGWQPVATGVTYGFNDATVLPDGTLVVAGGGGIVVTVPPAGKPVVVRRADRQAILGVVSVADGLVLVGEGGAKRANLDGSALIPEQRK